MTQYTRPDGATGFADMDDTVVVPSVATNLDTLFNGMIAAYNAIDNTNIAAAPKISATKVDLTTGGYLPLNGSADMSANMNHAFDGVFRTMRASGNGRIREYRGSDGAIWGVSYNTYWTGSAWSGRDVTDICTVLKMESDGLHYYHAVSAGVGVVPTWVEKLHVSLTGITTGSIQDSAVTQAKIADANVGQAELKSTTGEVSVAGTANLTLPGGEYGFYPQLKANQNTASTSNATILSSGSLTTTHATRIYLSDVTGGITIYAQQRYFQASPPYMIGNTLWGHFLFLLRDIATGTVRAAYEAEDPPWAYNGAIYLPKDDPGRLAEVPHPFADYWQKDPAIDGLEIVMVDLSTHDTKKWKTDNAKLGKGILEDLGAVVKGKRTVKPHIDYMLPNIPKFTDRVKIIVP